MKNKRFRVKTRCMTYFHNIIMNELPIFKLESKENFSKKRNPFSRQERERPICLWYQCMNWSDIIWHNIQLKLNPDAQQVYEVRIIIKKLYFEDTYIISVRWLRYFLYNYIHFVSLPYIIYIYVLCITCISKS